MTYPKANRTAQWFADDVTTSRMGPVEKIVWHTTEGTGWPPYDGGRIAPHYTARPDFDARRLEWRAHFPDTVNSRALQNPAGGVQTNLDGALQVEVVGTCDPSRVGRWAGRFLRAWDLEPWMVAGFADFVAWARRTHSVPMVAPRLWLNYGRDPRAPGRDPASYGASPARMTGRQWDAFRGHCGHQHVAENHHGDPGAFPMPEILAAATDLLEDTMSARDVEEITAKIPTPKELWGYAAKEYVDQDGNGVRDPRSVADILFATHSATLRIEAGQAKLIAAIETLSETIAGLPKA